MKEKKVAERRDSQKSGLSGELFVAAELLKREMQVSLTLGNAKSVDLLAYSEKNTEKVYKIQVKTLRKSNCFPLNIEKVEHDHIYVFVLLNKPNEVVEYFILSGQEIVENEKNLYCGKGTDYCAAVKIGPLKKHYKDRWDLFGLA
jgi:hypothetical protein